MFAFHRGDGLDAQNPFSKAQGSGKAPFSQQRYGGFLGGPIVRDRLHYFGSYEGSRQRETSVITATVVPVDQRETPNPSDGHNAFIKLDQPHDRQALAAAALPRRQEQLDRQRHRRPQHARARHQQRLAGAGHRRQPDHDPVVAGVERIPVPVGASLHVDRHRRLEHRRACRRSTVPPAASARPTTSRRAATRTGCSSSTTSPTRSASHDLKTGADISIIRAPTFFPRNGDGTFTFTTDLPFDPNNLATYPTQFTQSIADPNVDLDDDIYAFFVQDTWRVRTDLTHQHGHSLRSRERLQPDRRRARRYQQLRAAARRDLGSVQGRPHRDSRRLRALHRPGLPESAAQRRAGAARQRRHDRQPRLSRSVHARHGAERDAQHLGVVGEHPHAGKHVGQPGREARARRRPGGVGGWRLQPRLQPVQQSRSQPARSGRPARVRIRTTCASRSTRPKATPGTRRC